MPIEYLYHVDAKDRVLGQIERSQAHAEKLLHRSGVVFVFNSQNQIFLAIRSADKKIFPNCLDSACSYHTTYGESDLEAAKRELNEETGLTIEPTYCGKFLLDSDPDHMLVSVYRIKTEKGLALDPGEFQSGQFYPIRQAELLMNQKACTHWLKPAWKLAKKSIQPQ